MANIEQNVQIEGLTNLLANLNARLSNRRGSSPSNQTCPPDQPQSLRDLLCNLVGEQIQVTTAFGVVEGTLIAIQNDYIVMIDDTGAQILVRLESVEAVSEL